MENEEQISKKELLELTQISYGQLYRWKRKGLIPEEWFIRKSSFTGQETFFPKQRVLSRIQKIINMKDETSLDDLAEAFSPVTESKSINAEEIITRNIVTPDVWKIYMEFRGDTENLGMNDVLSAYILNKLITSGDIGLEEGKMLLEILQEGLIQFGDAAFEVFLIRKIGIFTCLAVSPPGKMCLDRGAKLIGRINTDTMMEECKLKMI
jgi:hypothetical protein